MVDGFCIGHRETHLRGQARGHGPFARTLEALETGTVGRRVRAQLIDGKGGSPRLRRGDRGLGGHEGGHPEGVSDPGITGGRDAQRRGPAAVLTARWLLEWYTGHYS